ncbi:MAG: phage/plasmid primase, P4 family [Oscillospiraceae bacterium]|nr:phage/plasmid primase, P4 family [Oscillospiraceae bacterium]
MDYIEKIRAAGFGQTSLYLQNDIGIARLFYDLHSDIIRYVSEAKTWFAYDGRRWIKTNGNFKAMELLKDFTQAFCEYAASAQPYDEDFLEWAGKLTNRRNRDGILNDARSIAPMSLSDFDKDKLLLNVQNGTFNLKNFALQPHDSADLITKMAKVTYDDTTHCERWKRYISEVMCDDTALVAYLQKALGYALTGLTEFECFFILYGSKTRNGKTTLTETIANILGDYACTAQPQTFARRSSDGASPSPDIARLKGARLINIPEPEKGMELNSALIKQLTGGDTYTGRFLHENPFEFRMDGKPFINTNHLPRVSDDTVFTSGRAKIIPFDRHFEEHEQDKGLKQLFRRMENKSAIFKWIVEGYRMILETGFEPPERVVQAIADYRQEADVIGVFLSECTEDTDGSRLPTNELYPVYSDWARANGYRALSNRSFTMDVHRRYEIRRDGAKGSVIIGLALKA